MPRYYFDLIDSKTITDQGGQELPDDHTAKNAAEMIARRLASEQPQLLNRHFAIVVTKQNGEKLCRVPLDLLH
jgi:hypothetical protein